MADVPAEINIITHDAAYNNRTVTPIHGRTVVAFMDVIRSRYRFSPTNGVTRVWGRNIHTALVVFDIHQSDHPRFLHDVQQALIKLTL